MTYFIQLIFVLVFFSHTTLAQVNIKQMSDEQKVAQLIIVRTYAPQPVENILKVFFPGGFIHHGRYNRSGGYPTQMKEMDNLQKMSLEKTKLPALFMVDQEGGSVNRFPRTTLSGKNLEIASLRRLGASGNLNLVHQFAEEVGYYLHAIGFNMNLAPVTDVFRTSGEEYIAGRSFSNNPHVVKKMSYAFSKGLEKAKVIAVYKHFPGYSSTIKNSHNQLVTIDTRPIDLVDIDWVPYQFNNKSGTPKALMSNIAIYPHLDETKTATLSKKIMTDILKDQLGYQGLIISDDIGMKGYKEKDVVKKSIQAIEAGHDMILLTEVSNKEIINIYRGLLNKFKTDKNFNNQVHASLKKIIQFKSSISQDDRPITERLESIAKYEEKLYETNLKIIQQIVDQSFKNSSLKNGIDSKQNIIVFSSNKKINQTITSLEGFQKAQIASFSNTTAKEREKILTSLKRKNYIGICYGKELKACERYTPSPQQMILIDPAYNPKEWDNKKYKAVFYTYGPSPKATEMILEKMIRR